MALVLMSAIIKPPYAFSVRLYRLVSPYLSSNAGIEQGARPVVWYLDIRNGNTLSSLILELEYVVPNLLVMGENDMHLTRTDLRLNGDYDCSLW